MSTMVMQLSAYLADFSSIQDILASVSAPVPPTPTTTPHNPASAPPSDDEMLGEKDFNLPNFLYISFLFEKYYNII